MRHALGALLLLSMIAIPPAAGAEPAVGFPRSEVAIVTGKGRHVFAVEVAATPAQHAWGLSGRQALPPGAGMLFDLGGVRPVSMWMKDAAIPLDMLFIDATGGIVGIEHDAPPGSERRIPSVVPVRAVLEVNAGTARRLGIAPGDRLLHPLFESDGGR